MRKKYLSKNAESDSSLTVENIKKQLNHTGDIKRREVHSHNRFFTLIYINTTIDQEQIETKVIEPLTKVDSNDMLNELYSEEVKRTTDLNEVVDGLLSGFCFLMEKGNDDEGFLLNVPASSDRQISEPVIEQTILGSHVGFVESLEKNIFLLRKITKTPNFTVKNFTVGSDTETDIVMMYVDGLVDPEVVKQVEKRIENTDVRSIKTVGDIQDWIEDSTFTPFPQLLLTERPDRASKNLGLGKVVLLLDGSPNAIVLPATFMTFFRTPDDYVTRWGLGSFFRFLRLFSYVNALMLPALYVAFVSFHYEVIPLELVYSLQSSLSYVPFRPVVELMIMQFSLELLREASIRLPPSVAVTFGIVGGVVVGTAMVEGGIVSYGGLIIVAITAVSSFVQPNLEVSSTIRVVGFPLMLLAAIFGFFGIFIGMSILIIHLSRLKSFGVPYFQPFAPLKPKDFKDTIFRTPSWVINNANTKSSNDKASKPTRKWKKDESEEPY